VHRVEVVEVEAGQHGQPHHAGRVDDHVDPAVPLLGGVEQGPDGGLVGDVGADRDGAAAGRLDRRHGGLRLGVVPRIPDHHGLPVGGQPLGDGAPDAAGPSGDDGDPSDVSHDRSPRFHR
jgi:hypothetical protein